MQFFENTNDIPAKYFQVLTILQHRQDCLGAVAGENLLKIYFMYDFTVFVLRFRHAVGEQRNDFADVPVNLVL